MHLCVYVPFHGCLKWSFLELDSESHGKDRGSAKRQWGSEKDIIGCVNTLLGSVTVGSY